MRRLAAASDLEPVYAVYFHDLVVPYLSYDPMGLDEFRPIFDELVDASRSSSGRRLANSQASIG